MNISILMMWVFGSIAGAVCFRASVLAFVAMDSLVGELKYFSRSCMISRQVSMSVSSSIGALLKVKSWVFNVSLPSVAIRSP